MARLVRLARAAERLSAEWWSRNAEPTSVPSARGLRRLGFRGGGLYLVGHAEPDHVDNVSDCLHGRNIVHAHHVSPVEDAGRDSSSGRKLGGVLLILLEERF